MNWRDPISINPKICQCKPCVKGTRVMVTVILDNLAEVESYESIADGYRVTPEDIQAAIAFSRRA